MGGYLLKKTILFLLLISALVACNQSIQIDQNENVSNLTLNNNNYITDDRTLEENNDMINNRIRIVSDTVEVKKEPYETSDTLVQLPKGLILEQENIIVNNNDSWYKIQYDHSEYGWINSNNCVQISDNQYVDSPTTHSVVITSNEAIAFFVEPDLAKSSVNTVMEIDEKYKIFDTLVDDNNILWYKVYSKSHNKLLWVKGQNCQLYTTAEHFPINDYFEINFEDIVLENYIREQFNIKSDIIHYNDIKNIKSLEIPFDYHITSIEGIQFFDNLTTLSISNANEINLEKLIVLTNLSDLQLSSTKLINYELVSCLQSLEYLWLTNCDIESIYFMENLQNIQALFLKENQIHSLTPLRKMTSIKQLHLESNKLTDIDPISSLIDLEMLHLGDNAINSISSLDKLINLKHLYIDKNNIRDIESLKSLSKLEKLSASNNKLISIDAINNLTNLSVLYLNENSIHDISSLSSLDKLRFLELNSNKISDISAIVGLSNLSLLDISNNTINDLGEIYQLSNLVSLDYHNNPVVSLINEGEEIVFSQPLELVIRQQLFDYTGKLTPEVLKYVNKINLVGPTHGYEEYSLAGIEHCINLVEFRSMDTHQNYANLEKLTKLRVLELGNENSIDLNFISNLDTLEEVSCISTKLSNLSTLKNALKLTKLTLVDCDIQDIDFIANMEQLEYLNLSQNNIASIESLKNLILLEELILSENQIDDISFMEMLANLKVLWLDDNLVKDISSIATLDKLISLRLKNNPIQEFTPLKTIQNQLEFCDTYIN